MSENINTYRTYTSETSYIYNGKEGDNLLPPDKICTTLEIASLGFDLLIETNLGTRAIAENSSTTFSDSTKNVEYAKILKGNSKICVTAGVVDYTPKEAIDFSLTKWGK
ncbi:MAG: hypothetical protein RSD67_08475 [Oscillospiraceae bacterium]